MAKKRNVGNDASRLDDFQQRAKEFARRFKLDGHHTIERFGVVTALLTVIGVFVVGTTVFASHEAGKADVNNVAQYTYKFTSSRTQNKGQVLGVYTNEAATRAFVMMKFDSPDAMSSNPKDYYVYGVGLENGAGSGPTKMAQPTAGAVYTFGTAGYLGVLLNAPSGFGKQVVNLTVRAKKELATPEAPPEAEGLDRTFVDYDQWRVVLNPGATGTKWMEALEGTSDLPKARDLYAQSALAEREAKQRQTLDLSLARMRTQLDRMHSFEEQMRESKVVIGNDRAVRMMPPTLPRWVTGDAINGEASSTVAEEIRTKPYSQIPGLKNKNEKALVLDSSIPDWTPNTFRLSSATTVAGGFNFDWRDKTVADGYIKDVIPTGTSVDAYLAKQAMTSFPELNTRELKWPLTNGKLLSDLGIDDPATKPLQDLRNNYAQAADAYAKLKAQYQRGDLTSLLALEQELDSAGTSSGVIAGPDAIEFRV